MKATEGFRSKLASRQTFANSLVIVGLDPVESTLPQVIVEQFGSYGIGRAVYEWMQKIVDATHPFVCMYKPNIAHWDAIPYGRIYLQELIRYIHKEYPDILVFLDCKVGDISRTQGRYAVSHLGINGADGMNFNPYMGKDCVGALAKEEISSGKGLVGLCYTSNPDAREIQDLPIAIDGGGTSPLWEVIAAKTLRWAEELGILADTGLVMAAAYENPKKAGQVYSYHLARAREIVGGRLWFLVPGIGAQGGFVEETIHAGYIGPGSLAINSSSGIISASQEADYAEAASGKAEELRDQIRKAGGNIKIGSGTY